MVDAYEFPNYWVTEQGLVISKKTNKTLTPVPRNGYFQIRLSKDGRVKCLSLHRLIYQSFRGKIKAGYHINHINGIRSDNSLNNLEETTPKENFERMLFLKKGEFVHTSKLTPDIVMDIRKAKAQGARSLDLAKKYSVGKSTINRIARGITWKHLPILEVDNTVWKNQKITGAMTRGVLESKYGKEYFSKITKGQKFNKHCSSCTCSNY